MAPEDEILEVKRIIESFYQFANIPIPANLKVNEHVAEVFGIMFDEARKRSKALAWVPRPPGGRASIAWLVMQLARGVFESQRSRLSFSCAREVILKWRSELEMASLGLVARRLPTWA